MAGLKASLACTAALCVLLQQRCTTPCSALTLRSPLSLGPLQALYCRRAWIRFLMGLEDRLLLAFYIKFLYDGFQ